MTETLSIRIDAKTKQRLDVLARRSRRSKSFLAAEAIAAYVQTEEWQFGEIQAGLRDVARGDVVNHEKVATWLKSWGTRSERKPPRRGFGGRAARSPTSPRYGTTSPRIGRTVLPPLRGEFSRPSNC